MQQKVWDRKSVPVGAVVVVELSKAPRLWFLFEDKPGCWLDDWLISGVLSVEALLGRTSLQHSLVAELIFLFFFWLVSSFEILTIFLKFLLRFRHLKLSKIRAASRQLGEPSIPLDNTQLVHKATYRKSLRPKYSNKKFNKTKKSSFLRLYLQRFYYCSQFLNFSQN